MRHTERLDTEALQGAGSFVVLRAMSRGERRRLSEFAEQAKERPEEADAATLETVCSCLVGWNWTDAQGRSIDLPVTPEVLDQTISDREFTFLAGAIWDVSFPSEPEKKG